MDLNNLLGAFLVVIGTHIFVHEVVVAIRCVINALGGTGSYSDAMNVLGGLVTYNSNTFDQGLKSAAQNNNPGSQFDKIIRVIGIGVTIFGLLLMTKVVSFFAQQGN